MGHGSKMPGFQKAMEETARRLKNAGRFSDVVCAYLEISQPSIPDAVASCVEKGATRVKVLPYFILDGMHVKKDIPEIVSAAREKLRDRAEIILCPHLGFDEKIVSLVKRRLKEEVACK